MAPDSATENVTGGALRSIYVGVSTDVNLGLPVFTFNDTKVFTGPAGAQNQGAGNLFPALATDDFGFVYAVWSVNSDIFYSFSTDQGTTWSNPINVSFPVNGGHANLFPWIAADANGHVASSGLAMIGPAIPTIVPLWSRDTQPRRERPAIAA